MWTVSCLALAVNSFKTVKWGSNCPLSQQQLDLMHLLILRERKTIKMFNHSFCIGFAPYLCLEEMPTNWIYSLWFGFTSFLAKFPASSFAFMHFFSFYSFWIYMLKLNCMIDYMTTKLDFLPQDPHLKSVVLFFFIFTGCSLKMCKVMEQQGQTRLNLKPQSCLKPGIKLSCWINLFTF